MSDAQKAPREDRPGTRLETGMLLLDPEAKGGPMLLTVVKPGKKPKVVAHFGKFTLEATLRTETLPDGWSIIGNRSIALVLARHGVRSIEQAPFTEPLDDPEAA